MSNKEVSLEELNSLNNQISRINDLSLKVNETSTQLKYVAENSKKITEHSEQLSKLFTKVALLEKDLEFHKTTNAAFQETTCHDIDDIIERLDDLEEESQERQGVVNQLRLIIETNETRRNTKKEKFIRFIKYFLYPVAVAITIFLFGYLFDKYWNRNANTQDNNSNKKIMERVLDAVE